MSKKDKKKDKKMTNAEFYKTPLETWRAFLSFCRIDCSVCAIETGEYKNCYSEFCKMEHKD